MCGRARPIAAEVCTDNRAAVGRAVPRVGEGCDGGMVLRDGVGLTHCAGRHDTQGCKPGRGGHVVAVVNAEQGRPPHRRVPLIWRQERPNARGPRCRRRDVHDAKGSARGCATYARRACQEG